MFDNLDVRDEVDSFRVHVTGHGYARKEAVLHFVCVTERSRLLLPPDIYRKMRKICCYSLLLLSLNAEYLHARRLDRQRLPHLVMYIDLIWRVVLDECWGITNAMQTYYSLPSRLFYGHQFGALAR